MNRKLLYTLTLFVVVVMWGVFAFAAGPVYAQPALQDTIVPATVVVTQIVNTIIAPGVTQVVPVTSTPGPSIMLLLFYGFMGLLAIVLLVALFASANRTTYV